VNEDEWSAAYVVVCDVVRTKPLPWNVLPEDAVAETLLRVMRRRRPVGVDRLAFLVSAARYELSEYLRSGAGVRRAEATRRKRGEPYVGVALTDDFSALSFSRGRDGFARTDDRDEAARLLRRLAHKYRRTLRACFLTGADDDREIAKRLKCRPWSVSRRRRRALEEARRAVGLDMLPPCASPY
jgi:DNA-directed RNA polymerase specialized sigma24 family protein